MHHNFETLQKQYRSYRFKQLIKQLFPLLLLIIVSALAAYMYFQPIEPSEMAKPVLIEKHDAVEHNEIISHTQPVVEETAKPEPVAPQKQTIKATTKVIKDVTYDLHVDDTYIPSTKTALPPAKKETGMTKSNKLPEKKQVVVNTPAKEVHITDVEPKAKSNLSMSTKKVSSLDETIALYDKEPSYTQALKIAQEYFDLEKYSNASLWSKKANMLDREADGAWILYAKSEYARGNEKRAIEILRLYVANATSHEADELLLTWTQGK